MIRDTIKTATTASMKAGTKDRTATLRMIAAKIKDRDIELRTSDKQPEDHTLVSEVLQKMAKQRRESIQMYEDGGREELAAKERDELAVISEFLPQMLNDEELRAAIEEAKAATGAEDVKDMGKVMAELKARHGAVLDGAKASAMVKESLA